jgi:hypothetical protein
VGIRKEILRTNRRISASDNSVENLQSCIATSDPSLENLIKVGIPMVRLYDWPVVEVAGR